MKSSTNRIFLMVVAALFLSGVIIGQDREDRDAIAAAAGNLYVVSVKAGGVSYAEGDVTISRADSTSGRITPGEYVKVGDVVSTGNSGRAEIMMNPGSFVRLDHNSKFSFNSTSLSTLNINIISGSAIFEVFASDDFRVTVEAGTSRFYLVKSGVYRVDMDSSGKARLEVWKGTAQAGNTQASKIGKGRTAALNGNSYEVAKFKRNMDSFEVWSKARAKEVAKRNRKLAAQNLGTSVLSSFRNNRWDCYDSVGLWVFDPTFRAYSFLPFGYGWRSPYGYRLGHSTGICNFPSSYWRYDRWPRRGRRGNGNGDGTGTGGGGGTTTTTTTPQANIDRGNRVRTPPFQRMQQTRSVKRTSAARQGGGGWSPTTTGNRTTRSTSTKSNSQPAASKRPASSPTKTTSTKNKIN